MHAHARNMGGSGHRSDSRRPGQMNFIGRGDTRHITCVGIQLIFVDKLEAELALDTAGIHWTKCGMIFASFLLLVATDATAATMPRVTLDCHRDNAGNCLSVEPSPPARLLVGEQDHAAEIYRPYWICYWNNLKVQEGFGTSDPQRATEIFTSAMNACASHKASADRNMDAFLRPLAVYGDDAHKRFVRDYFRSSAGDAFLDQVSSTEGRHADFSRTRNAYQQLILGQIRDAQRE